MAYAARRGRCAELLQHAEAFRARGRARSVYALDAESRPVLPAARTTEAMTEELLGWAAQMPIFATHLTGTCLLHVCPFRRHCLCPNLVLLCYSCIHITPQNG